MYDTFREKIGILREVIPYKIKKYWNYIKFGILKDKILIFFKIKSFKPANPSIREKCFKIAEKHAIKWISDSTIGVNFRVGIEDTFEGEKGILFLLDVFDCDIDPNASTSYYVLVDKENKKSIGLYFYRAKYNQLIMLKLYNKYRNQPAKYKEIISS